MRLMTGDRLEEQGYQLIMNVEGADDAHEPLKPPIVIRIILN